MLNVIWSLFAFLIAVGLLVTVHEFGHFWVARKLGVKVLKFSIGFGKTIFSKKTQNGTEIVIAALPLGGYVKMLDATEQPVASSELAFAFNRQPVWKRMAIVIAGPVMNILFAILCFWAMYMIGIQSLAPITGAIRPGSIADNAGIRSNQRILAVDDVATSNWQQVNLQLLSHIGNRDAIKLTLRDRDTKEEYEEVLDLKNWHNNTDIPEPLSSLGLSPYIPEIPTYIDRLMKDGPADQAGIRKGDEIVALNHKPVASWQQLAKFLLNHNQATKIQVTVKRSGVLKQFTVYPEAIVLDNGTKGLRLGIASRNVQWPEDILQTERFNVLPALVMGCQETWQMFTLSAQLLWKMCQGLISPKNITGPIGIAEQAGVVAKVGFAYYLGFLGLISVSMALLNILPIPMLDGGHLLYYLAEIILKRPISERTMELGYRIGGILLIAVLLLALINDVTRIIHL